MIAVGIDVAKSKSMVAILSDDGEIIKEPFENQVTLVYNLLRKVFGIEVSDCPQY